MQFAGTGKIVFYKTLTNYSKMIIDKNKFNIFYEKKFELDKISTDHIWVICLPTISPTRCSSLKSIKSFVILQNKSFGSINLKLIRVI